MDIDCVPALRRFARTFTASAGLLRERLYDEDLSLTEARILFEAARAGDGVTAESIGASLRLDKGYLSRTIARLERRGLVVRARAANDRRRRPLALTPAGRTLFDVVDRRSSDDMAALTAHLTPPARRQLRDALTLVETLLKPVVVPSDFAVRVPEPGDLGHVVSRHGALYAAEYGWDIGFEGAVAEIVAQFLQTNDPLRECCLIAETDGVVAGSAMVVRMDDQTAKLRIVYVEPWARGCGLGERLVMNCMTFARAAGYGRMKLWTNDVLTPARRLYERLGFRLTESEPHRSFGKDLVGETWERSL